MGCHARRRDQADHVSGDYPPADRVSQGPVQHGMSVVNGGWADPHPQHPPVQRLDLLDVEIPNPSCAQQGQEVDSAQFLVPRPGPRPKIGPYRRQPHAPEPPEGLARPQGQLTLLISPQRRDQLAADRLPRLAVQAVPVSTQNDGRLPATILAPVDGAFSSSPPTHRQGPFPVELDRRHGVVQAQDPLECGGHPATGHAGGRYAVRTVLCHRPFRRVRSAEGGDMGRRGVGAPNQDAAARVEGSHGHREPAAPRVGSAGEAVHRLT